MNERGGRDTLRHWRRLATGCICAALVVTAVFGEITWHTPWRAVIETFLVSLLFSVCIGPPVATVMPRLGPKVWCKYRFPLNWAAMIAVMIVIATVGSLLALVILTAIGFLEGGRVFATWFAGSLRISIIVTLTFGILVTAYEVMRAQLDAATLALRTKERDEADARRVAVEAQLASIESRVQPHFLFNTLNSIAALVHEDPGGAERMTGQLASLMRSALDSQSTPLTPLYQELRVVRDYLEIEGVRFGSRLRFTVDLPEEAGAVLVPRLSLQTLVENSVKFAVSPRRAGASIAVRAVAVNGVLRITVEDDGPGFDAGIPDGHGLELLRSRLAILFGDRAALVVDSRPGRTAVSIDVPTAGSSS
jgi:two-component system, LytTR family, sensor histidine kinase AlgZ